MSQRVSSSHSSGSHADSSPKKRRFQQPPGTEEYVVTATDTFSSIAVKCGVTTSELKRLNKLFSVLIFPGQVLYVPSRGVDSRPFVNEDVAVGIAQKSTSTKPPPSLEPTLPKHVVTPVNATVVITPAAEPEEAKDALSDDLLDDTPSAEKVTVVVRYVTKAEGVVRGQLVITPSTFAFRPRESETLVMERGCDQYTVDLDFGDITSLGVYDRISNTSLPDPASPVEGTQSTFLFCQQEELSRIAAVTQQTTLAVGEACFAASRNSSESDVSLAEDALASEQPRSRGSSMVVERETRKTPSPPVNGRLPDRSSPVEPLVSSPFRYLCVRTSSLTSSIPPHRDEDDNSQHHFILALKCVGTLYKFLDENCPCLQNVQPSEVAALIASYSDLSSTPKFKALKMVEDYFDLTEADKQSLSPQEQSLKSTVPASPRAKSPVKPPALRHRISVSDIEMPVLTGGRSKFMLPEHLMELSRHLPRRVVGCQWVLTYSTSVHGFSLQSLYRHVDSRDGPYLVVVQDTNNHVFGVLSASTIHVSDQFEGTGESFVFTFHDGIKCKMFHWTGDNSFFIKGDMQSIAFGSGEGRFGLWLDGDLYYGSSRPCKTFDNEVLSSEVDFTCQDLEVWGFLH